MAWRLSRAAEDDVVRIHRDSASLFGDDHADAYVRGLEAVFRFLAENPRAARERLEIDPPVRVHPYRAHVVIYVLDADEVLIVRIRHAREDWLSDPD